MVSRGQKVLKSACVRLRPACVVSIPANCAKSLWMVLISHYASPVVSSNNFVGKIPRIFTTSYASSTPMYVPRYTFRSICESIEGDWNHLPISLAHLTAFRAGESQRRRCPRTPRNHLGQRRCLGRCFDANLQKQCRNFGLHEFRKAVSRKWKWLFLQLSFTLGIGRTNFSW